MVVLSTSIYSHIAFLKKKRGKLHITLKAKVQKLQSNDVYLCSSKNPSMVQSSEIHSP